jgi:hypothetical protein
LDGTDSHKKSILSADISFLDTIVTTKRTKSSNKIKTIRFIQHKQANKQEYKR